jgi:hypothetical protein
MAQRSAKTCSTALIVIILLALAFTASADQARQQLQTKAPLKSLVKTILRTNRLGGCYVDTQDWVTKLRIDTAKTTLAIRCLTQEEGIAAGRWILADERYVPGGGTHIVATENLPFVPVKGGDNCFSIKLQDLIPAAPPAPPYSTTYYVYVALFDGQNKELAASAPLTVVYSASTEGQTVFDENMGLEGDTLAQGLIQKAYQQLKSKFGLTDALGPAKTGKNLAASQRFSTNLGKAASIEVVMTAPSPTIYVCVPRMVTGDDTIERYAHQWFEYIYVDGRVAWPPVLDKDQDPPPDYVQPRLLDTGAWAAYDQYDIEEAVNPSNDPPHWTSILTEPDLRWAKKIHRLMQMQGTSNQALAEISAARERAKTQSLRDRALEPWESVKLCGLIQSAGYPSGDLSGDHTTWYRDGDEVPFDEDFWVLGEITDHSSPGQDWDITCLPDDAYMYLSYKYETRVGVEIEQFTLVPPDRWPGAKDDWLNNYWPQKGEWLQTVGRWVTDNGHPQEVDFDPAQAPAFSGDGPYTPDLIDGFYTEIHPPELLVATRTLDDYSSEARVLVTGAWRGTDMSFAVNPPPRPSPDSVLRWKIVKMDRVTEGYDRQDGVKLDLIPKGKPGNPNHLECIVRKTAPGGTARVSNGAVGYYKDRGLNAIILCEWIDSSGTITGNVKVDGRPVKGAYVFVREHGIMNPTWRTYKVNDNGSYKIGHLAPERAYWLRPAGSGMDFDAVPVKLAFVNNVMTLHQDFNGKRAVSTSRLAALGRLNPQRSEAKVQAKPQAQPQAVAQGGAWQSPEPLPSGTPEQKEAWRLIQSMLLSVGEPEGNLGVWRNGMGYTEQGPILVALRGLEDENGQPVADLSSAYSVGQAPAGSNIVVRGVRGSGVAGAKIRLRLLLGNAAIGLPSVREVEAVTNAKGIATFRFEAGHHFEEGAFAVEVLENPYNPWFKPVAQGPVHMFYPVKGGGDIPQDPSVTPKPYEITVLKLSAPNARGLARELGQGLGYVQEFAWGLREGQSAATHRLMLKGKAMPKKPVAAKLKKKASADRLRENK